MGQRERIHRAVYAQIRSDALIIVAALIGKARGMPLAFLCLKKINDISTIYSYLCFNSSSIISVFRRMFNAPLVIVCNIIIPTALC